ncbi:MAG TPA: RNA-binding protein [Rhodanobacteraceae bacterium]|nr:RNA-binding protein [Rhodanobacteraceae bacterium]
MLLLNVRGLPRSMTEQALSELFSRYGRVHKLKLAMDPFKGECRGFAELSMEGHEARAAIAGLDGSTQDGASLRVGLASDRPQRGRR